MRRNWDYVSLAPERVIGRLRGRRAARAARAVKLARARAESSSPASAASSTKNEPSEPSADFSPQEAPTKPSVPHPPIEQLIARSSLGSPGAVAVRAMTPQRVVESIEARLRAAELDTTAPPIDDVDELHRVAAQLEASKVLNEFEQQVLEAWNDDSIEFSSEDEQHIDAARARVLALVKDQALLDWLDDSEIRPAQCSGEPTPIAALELTDIIGRARAGGRPETGGKGMHAGDSWSGAPVESMKEGDADVRSAARHDNAEPGQSAQASAPLVRVTGGALADVEQQQYGPDEVFRRFLMNRADGTLKAYKADLDTFAAWLRVSSDDAVGRLLGHGAAAANALAIEWLDSMASLAPSTRKRRLSALRSIVRMARRLGAVDWALDVDSPKVEAYRNTAGPTEDEFHRLFAACGDGLEGLRNRALVLLATLMGWRRRELAAFKLQDYDRERRRLFVRGKGGKSKWVGAPDEVVDALEAWLSAPKTIVDMEKVFLSLSPRTRGEALTRKGINTLVAKIGKSAGVKIWPHAFRHAGVTAVLDESGGDVRMAQQFARHGDPKTTMLYDDNRKDMAGQAAKLVARKLMPK